MNLFSQILGRTKPTSVNITRLIAEASADLETNRKRLAAAEENLQRVAVLSPTEHAGAEAEQAEARRAIVRAEARIAELQKALVEVQEGERLANLKARAEAARRRVEIDAPKVLDRYASAARLVAEAVSELQAIDAEVEGVNAELRKADFDPIETAESRFRREPDQIIPGVRTKRKKWIVRDHWTGAERDVAVFTEQDGRLVPNEGGAFEVEVEDVIPAQTIPGRWLDSLAGSVRLPPARVGSAWHWPKVEG